MIDYYNQQQMCMCQQNSYDLIHDVLNNLYVYYCLCNCLIDNYFEIDMIVVYYLKDVNICLQEVSICSQGVNIYFQIVSIYLRMTSLYLFEVDILNYFVVHKLLIKVLFHFFLEFVKLLYFLHEYCLKYYQFQKTFLQYDYFLHLHHSVKLQLVGYSNFVLCSDYLELM